VSEQSRLEINWFNALGGALGAVSAAVVLSSLGTAGTLIGAAIGSLCITIGGAIYAHSMRVATNRLQSTRAMLARGIVPAEAPDARSADGELLRSEEPDADDVEGVEEEVEPASRESRIQMLRSLPWKRIAVASVALFAVAMGAIVAFELSTGRTVSSYTGGSDTDGGTSVPGLGGRGGDSDDREEAPVEPQDEPPAEQRDGDGQEPAAPEETAPPPVQEPTGEPAPLPPPEEPEADGF
jgi:hypothetical protein